MGRNEVYLKHIKRCIVENIPFNIIVWDVPTFRKIERVLLDNKYKWKDYDTRPYFIPPFLTNLLIMGNHPYIGKNLLVCESAYKQHHGLYQRVDLFLDPSNIDYFVLNLSPNVPNYLPKKIIRTL